MSLLTGLTIVIQIELYNNSLSCELLARMSNLTKLQLLDASMNQLTETIPDELCGLQLESLNLYKNRFEGSLLESIANSPKLYELRIFKNGLTGESPRNLDAKSLLKWINISNKKFFGEIPTSSCQMGKLGNFDFTSHFHFSGIFDNFNNWVIG